MKKTYSTLCFRWDCSSRDAKKDPATDPNDPPTPPVKASISVSPRTLSFSADATDEKHTVTVTATSDEWTLEVPSDAKWIIVSETAQQSEQALDKSGRTVTVGASSNEELESRSACIYFYLEDAKDSVIVTQIGQEPAIEVAEDQYEAKAEGETLTVDVTTNVEYTVVIPEDCDWIASEIQQNGAKVALTVAENINTESRTATVTLTSEQNKVSATVTVTQAAAEERVRETDDIFIPFASAETASSASAYPVEKHQRQQSEHFLADPLARSGFSGHDYLRLRNYSGRAYRLFGLLPLDALRPVRRSGRLLHHGNRHRDFPYEP
ncbi:MAG: BACON domain-containing protein [Alistipes putredinis]|nr:MAG: BACON domain-containing protein [Alistipes putredinis]